MAPLRHIIFALAAATTVLAQIDPAWSYVGCFSSSSGLTEFGTAQFQSTGLCQGNCTSPQGHNSAVMGLTNGDDCYCGATSPPASTKVDNSQCDSKCTGFGQFMCGGSGFYSVYLTKAGGDSSSGTSSSSSSSASSSSTPGTGTSTGPATVVTSISPGKTVVITQSANPASNSASATPASSSSKPNTAAIAAGVVVGVLAVAAIAGAAFFFLRQRRRRAAESDYKKHQVSDFMAGGKSAPLGRSPSGPDSRFHAEAMAHRRLSDGSIADNEDYSRRILKVTNPDDRA